MLIPSLKKKSPLSPSFSYIPILMMVASILGPMSMVILTPALPLMETDFNSTPDSVQRILSVYLAGFSISGFFYGALSESLGRRLLFLLGIALFSIGAFLSYFASNLEYLMIFQIIQGCGIGVGILTSAVIADLYQGKESIKLISIFGVLVPLMTSFSPFIGGHIAQYFGWSSIFLLLSIVGCCFFIALYFFFPETHKIAQCQSYSFKRQIGNYGVTLRNTSFLKFMMIMCFSFSGLWVYQTTAPFVFIEHFNLSPSEYGIYPIISVLGIILGNIIVNRITHIWCPTVFLKIGAAILLGGILILLCLTMLSCCDPLSFTLCMALYYFGCAPIFSIGLVSAIANAFHGKGYAAALIRGGQFISASIVGLISGFLYTGSFLYPGLLILVCIMFVNFLAWTIPKESL